MTIQAVSGVMYPDYSAYGNLLTGTTTYTTFLLDAAAEKLAGIIVAPKAGDIARVHFRTGTVTTGDTMKVSLQDVDPATGDPDGGADQFRTQVIADADDNVWFRTGLVTSDGTDTGTLRTVTKGQVLAWVIEFNSFVAGNLNLVGKAVLAGQGPFVGRHYLDHFTAAWAKQTGSVQVAAIEYSDGSFAYIPNTFPATTQASITIGSASTPDEIALKFRLPFPARVSGWYLAGNIAGDADIVLYDSDGTTVLETQSIDKDIRASAANLTAAGTFATARTLTANTFYYLAFKPGATNCFPFFFTVDATPGAVILNQISGGQDAHWAQRTDAGAWTPDTLKRPVMGLILDGLDDGAGVGGGAPVIHRGRGREVR